MELTQGHNVVTNRQMTMSDMGPEFNFKPIKPQIHKYCFVTGRHGEFLYLKLGAAWFAFGLLIHSILNLTYQIFDPLLNKYSAS